MDPKDKAERLRESLKAAPRRERKDTAAEILRPLRADIVRARKEKNLRWKDVLALLATEGVEVSLTTLKRHAQGGRKEKRGGSSPTEQSRPAAKPAAASPAQKAPAASLPARPPVKTPDPPKPTPASKPWSFPVRPDSDEI